MSSTNVNCPLCFQSTFPSIQSLCLSLISVTTRLLECPICNDSLIGLDKYTIHLFGHVINQQQVVVHSNSNYSTNNTINLQVPFINEQNHITSNENVSSKCKEIINNSNSISTNEIYDKHKENVNNNYNDKSCESNPYVLKVIQESNNSNQNINLLQAICNCNNIIIPNNEETNTNNNNNNNNSIEDKLKKNLEPFLKYNNKVKTKYNQTESKEIESNHNQICSKQVESIHKQRDYKEIKSIHKQRDSKEVESIHKQRDSKEVKSIHKQRDSKEIGNENSTTNIVEDNIMKFNNENKIMKFNIQTISKEIQPKDIVYKEIIPMEIGNITKLTPYQNSNDHIEERLLESERNFNFFNNSNCVYNHNKKLETDLDDSMNIININNEKKEISNINTKDIFQQTLENNDTLVNSTVINGTFETHLIKQISNNDNNNENNKSCLEIIRSKDTTSQAIQTVEESFTKTKSNLNEVRMKLLHDSTPSSDLQNNPNLEEVNTTISNINTINNNVHTCDICLFSFPDQNILKMHEQLVHSDVNMNEKRRFYACHLCSKSFKMRGSLMVHRRVAHPTTAVLKRLEAVSVAVSSAIDGTDSLSPGGDQLFNCSICGKTFKKEQHLMQHEKTHEAKQWECDICSKAFSTKYFLKKHTRLHTGEMPYSCTTCGKSFTFQQSYHKHLLYHSDEKPYVCNYLDCGRAFKELSTLHNHQRIHTGEKPFSCETCGKCFRQRVSYLVHRRIHTGAMPYKCTICNRSFRYKVSERTHKCVSMPSPPTSKSFIQGIERFTNDIGTKINNITDKLLQRELEKHTSNNICSMITTEGNNERKESNSNNITTNTASTSVTLEVLENSCETINKNLETDNNIITNKSNHRTKRISTSTATSDISNTDLFETTDFFSLILSPSPNICSPSEHLRHLTLSPNTSNHNWDLPSYSSSSTYNEINLSAVKNINNNDSTKGNLIENGGNFMDNMETMNDQSIKQLLYDL